MTDPIAVTHLRTDVPADSGSASLIQPSDWLDGHVIVGAIGASEGATLNVVPLLDDRALVGAPLAAGDLWRMGFTARITVPPEPGTSDSFVRVESESGIVLLEVDSNGIRRQSLAPVQDACWAFLVLAVDDARYINRAWAALTGMPADAATNGGGFMWYASTPGTSGAVEPDWAGAGATVADGSVVWTKSVEAPTAGTVVLYPLWWTAP